MEAPVETINKPFCFYFFSQFQICNTLNAANIKKATKVQAGILKPRNVQSTLAQSPVPLNINLSVSNKGKFWNMYSSPGPHSGTSSGGKCCNQTCRVEIDAPDKAVIVPNMHNVLPLFVRGYVAPQSKIPDPSIKSQDAGKYTRGKAPNHQQIENKRPLPTSPCNLQSLIKTRFSN